MIYKWYVNEKCKFTTHNPMDAPIRQDVKNSDKNSEKQKMMTINTGKIVGKKKTMTIKISILYNILVNRASANGNPLCIKFQNWCLGGGGVLV